MNSEVVPEGCGCQSGTAQQESSDRGLPRGNNEVEDVSSGWNSFVAKQREEDMQAIIRDEKLKEPETRAFLEISSFLISRCRARFLTTDTRQTEELTTIL